MVVSYIFIDWMVASEGDPMLRKTMMVLATAATFTAVLTVDAFARGFGGGFAGGGFRTPIIRSAKPRWRRSRSHGGGNDDHEKTSPRLGRIACPCETSAHTEPVAASHRDRWC